jgi:hypothetical protein
MADRFVRNRSVRMSDEQWESIAELAARRGHNIVDEIKEGMAYWVAISGQIPHGQSERKRRPVPRRRVYRSIMLDREKEQ